MTITQNDALQVREVDVGQDRAFSQATNAMIDAGYQVEVSDSAAGLLTGEKRQDPAVATNVAIILLSAIASRGMFVQDQPPDYHAVCLQITPTGPGRSSVRFRPFVNGQALSAADPAAQKTVEELWTLMQRQGLMKEPPAPGPTSQ